MTKRKIDPRYIPSLAERRIQDAMEAGEFDALPGAGEPIPDLEDGYDPDWWVKKWAKREGIDGADLAMLLKQRRGA